MTPKHFSLTRPPSNKGTKSFLSLHQIPVSVRAVLYKRFTKTEKKRKVWTNSVIFWPLRQHSSKIGVPYKINKTGTSKVGAISKAQKAQDFFLKKNLKFLIFFSLRKCRIVPKNVKGGTLWALLTYILLQNIKKLERGTLLRH